MRTSLRISFVVAALMLSGVATFSCKADGTVDMDRVAAEASLSAMTLRDIAVVYDADRPALAFDLRRVADLADVVSDSLYANDGTDWEVAAEAALDLAESLLAEEDDPDLQAALIILRAGLARAVLYGGSGSQADEADG